MGWTSENVAADFGVTRAQQDEYAAMSFQRAERAQKEGRFQNEIVPFKAFVKQQDGSRKEVIVTQDEGIRWVRFQTFSGLYRRGTTGRGQPHKLLGRYALRSLNGVMEQPLVGTQAK